MTTFVVQYLGTRPKEATPAAVRERLREAFSRLPISMVLLDWDLPPALEEAAAKETQAQHAKLYRWQTWLTGDLYTDLPDEWAVIGANGESVSGYAHEADFTFVCPNHSGVEDFLSERMEDIAAKSMFQGVFLDRIRFPSPAADPSSQLGCFCRHCRRLAADRGLDLEAARVAIQEMMKSKEGAASLCRSLLGKPDHPDSLVERVLDFREESVTRVVRSAFKQAKSLGLEVGLDCFSPALTRMVGQDLNSLCKLSDWVKIMTYPRVFGPAGVSFELVDLLDWLMKNGLAESDAIALIQEASGLQMPPTRAELRRNGLDSQSIAREIRRGRQAGMDNLLAGIAMVKVKDVHESTSEQIREDLSAAKESDGLVLSWDLWAIPTDTLDSIRCIWEIQ